MTKNTLILVGILIALTIVAFLVLQQPGERSVTEPENRPFLTLDSANVTSITITSQGTSVVLARRGSEWILDSPGEHRADPVAIGALLTEAKKLTVRSVVSTKAEKHSIFQVDTTGTLITLRSSASDSVSFVLGKSAPGFSEVYARLTGSNDVVLVNAAISYTAKRPGSEWRDRAIIRMPKEEIREIRFQYGDTTFTVAWKDTSWTIDDQPAQEWGVTSLVSALSDFKADEFVETPPTTPGKPVASISFAGTLIRFFLPKGADKYLVHSSSSSQWYRIESWRAAQVLKRKKDLVTTL
jgi:hypothetical protein